MRKNEVLLSVRPQYANLLVSGIKTIELRRRFPTNLPLDTRCIIYSTSPEKSVIGECRISKVELLPMEKLWNKAASQAMIPWDDFRSYFEGRDSGFAIHVHSYLRYKNPLSLDQVTGANSRPPQSYRYIQDLELSSNI